MFRDFRDDADGAVIETGICIIGAGAAGIALAREFLGRGRDVLLVEGGDLDPEGETMTLNRGPSVGEPHPPLEYSRLRYFGGTTNHWDGHCRPLDPIDFEARPWVPYSGWPITAADLAPFYPRAQDVCELGPADYAPQTWAGPLPSLIDFDDARVVNRIWQLSPPTRFGERYRDELAQDTDIQVLLNANVTEIVLNEAGTAVAEVTLRALSGKTGRVRPRTVILACGGIENPRLLLASNSVRPAGVGNDHDLVGRFYMEHPHAVIAYAVPQVDIARFRAYFEGVEARARIGTATIRVKAGLSEAVQRERGLANACTDIGYGYDRSEGFLALRDVGRDVLDGRIPDGLGAAVLEMASDLDGLAGGLYRRLTETNMLWFGANPEQVPNPESRVTLDTERDAVGVPRPRLDWRLTAQDKETTRQACRIVGEELARQGIARMHLDDWLLAEDAEWPDLQARYHDIGTTRMSDDPRSGVVDRDCRVHGVDNLFVAGSSVFTTSGYANPTLTIVALAIRLADHLKTTAS